MGDFGTTIFLRNPTQHRESFPRLTFCLSEFRRTCACVCVQGPFDTGWSCPRAAIYRSGVSGLRGGTPSSGLPHGARFSMSERANLNTSVETSGLWRFSKERNSRSSGVGATGDPC